MLTFRRNAMGCEFRLVFQGTEEQPAHDTAIEAWELLDRLDNQASHHKPKSEVSRINALAADEPVLVSPELFDLLLFARDMWLLTDGYLDIALGPVAKAWGFFAGDIAEPPPATIQAAKQCSGFGHVRIDPERRLIFFERKGVTIDFAALGKGYALDRMADLLRERQIPAAFLSAGGSSAYGYGNPEGWTVRLVNPENESEELGTVALVDQGLSTSGPSRQSLLVAGKRRSHLIDPRTFEPCTSGITATVIAPTALEAEALSTALSVSATPCELPAWLPRYLASARDVVIYLAWRDEGRTMLRKVESGPQGNVTRTEKYYPEQDPR